MNKSVIWKIYMDMQKTKHFTLPDELLPAEKGINLLKWVSDLFTYYNEHGSVVRAFDDLPPLKLSKNALIETTIQDVHKFMINDLNLIAPEIRKAIVRNLISDHTAQDSWKNIVPILIEQFNNTDAETVREGLSWKFSPVSEILQAITWFFIEKEDVVPPKSIQMRSARFPYYRWETTDAAQVMWQPENLLCRWEWLAFDLYNSWQEQSQK